MGTIEYQLRNSSIDVMAEMMRDEDMETYLQKEMGCDSHEDNVDFSNFFVENGGRMALAYMFDSREGIDLVDAMRTAMMTGFLFGIQYERRFPKK